MSNNNNPDPAASTQMFQAFAQGQTPNSPTPVTAQRGSGNLGKALAVVAAVIVVALIIYFVA